MKKFEPTNRGRLSDMADTSLVCLPSVGAQDISSLTTGKRLTQDAKPADCKFLTYNSWRTRLL